MASTLSLFTSAMASGLRGWSGIRSEPASEKPLAILRLYDIENCPFCRIVREVLTELDLDAEIYPCPKGGTRFRAALREKTGQAQFPFLEDPNTGAELFESLDIIDYLYATYGHGELPLKWRLGGLQKLSSSLASAARLNQGMAARPSTLPAEMLELYSFEASPFARPVRELLCALEIPYILRNCGRTELQEWLPPGLREQLQLPTGSRLPNRVALQSREGRMGIPYLWDPNVGEGLFESGDIIAAIEARYAR